MEKKRGLQQTTRSQKNRLGFSERHHLRAVSRKNEDDVNSVMAHRKSSNVRFHPRHNLLGKLVSGEIWRLNYLKWGWHQNNSFKKSRILGTYTLFITITFKLSEEKEMKRWAWLYMKKQMWVVSRTFATTSMILSEQETIVLWLRAIPSKRWG